MCVGQKYFKFKATHKQGADEQDLLEKFAVWYRSLNCIGDGWKYSLCHAAEPQQGSEALVSVALELLLRPKMLIH